MVEWREVLGEDIHGASSQQPHNNTHHTDDDDDDDDAGDYLCQVCQESAP